MMHDELHELKCPYGIHYICDMALTCNGALHCICTGTSHFMGVSALLRLNTTFGDLRVGSVHLDEVQ